MKLKALAFDLDGTLTESKAKLENEMGDIIISLTNFVDIIIITGGKFEQIMTQFLNQILSMTEKATLKKFHLLPTNGASYLKFNGNDWESVYEYSLSYNEKRKVLSALNEVYSPPNKIWGHPIEDRKCQITLSWLGQEAPIEEKRKWDPTGEKRRVLVDKLSNLLTDMEVKSGGSTSIDITKKGIDKGFGMKQLMQYTDFNFDNLLFFGDALHEGGNDYPVHKIGIRCMAVSGPEETKALLRVLLNMFLRR